jgi:hypothetical protein
MPPDCARYFAVLLACGCLACTGACESAAGIDVSDDGSGGSDNSGPRIDARPHPDVVPTVAVWVGGSQDDGNGFVDWENGNSKPKIIRGPQGGQHIWVSARAKGMHPKKIRLGVEMFDAETGDPMKPGRVEVTVSLKPEDWGWELYAGIPAFVKEPCKVMNRKLKVKFDASDLYGVGATDEAFIWPTWDGACQ